MTGAARARAAYFGLLAAQTLAASFIFLTAFPLFQAILAHSGEPQPLPASTALPILAAALLLQACYWTRYRCVPVWTPLRGALAAHLLLFAGRASFIFASAIFSAIFFRHLPQLDVLPPLGQGIAKGAGLLGVLFSLYCYATEIERLGRAAEPPA